MLNVTAAVAEGLSLLAAWAHSRAQAQSMACNWYFRSCTTSLVCVGVVVGLLCQCEIMLFGWFYSFAYDDGVMCFGTASAARTGRRSS